MKFLHLSMVLFLFGGLYSKLLKEVSDLNEGMVSILEKPKTTRPSHFSFIAHLSQA